MHELRNTKSLLHHLLILLGIDIVRRWSLIHLSLILLKALVLILILIIILTILEVVVGSLCKNLLVLVRCIVCPSHSLIRLGLLIHLSGLLGVQILPAILLIKITLGVKLAFEFRTAWYGSLMAGPLPSFLELEKLFKHLKLLLLRELGCSITATSHLTHKLLKQLLLM